MHDVIVTVDSSTSDAISYHTNGVLSSHINQKWTKTTHSTYILLLCASIQYYYCDLYSNDVMFPVTWPGEVIERRPLMPIYLFIYLLFTVSSRKHGLIRGRARFRDPLTLSAHLYAQNTLFFMHPKRFSKKTNNNLMKLIKYELWTT